MSLLKSRWLRWLVIFIAALAIAAYAALQLLMPHPATPQELSAAMRAQAKLTGPAKVYAATCAHCHEINIAPVLRGRALPAVAVSAIVRKGAGAMPAFTPGQIDDSQLAELAAYVSQLPASVSGGKTP